VFIAPHAGFQVLTSSKHKSFMIVISFLILDSSFNLNRIPQASSYILSVRYNFSPSQMSSPSHPSHCALSKRIGYGGPLRVRRIHSLVVYREDARWKGLWMTSLNSLSFLLLKFIQCRLIITSILPRYLTKFTSRTISFIAIFLTDSILFLVILYLPFGTGGRGI
jgi:hypothetical protein